MIIYAAQDLDNQLLIDELQEEAVFTGMTSPELQAVSKAYPPLLYTPDFLVRAGFFLLTTVVVSAIAALILVYFDGSLRGKHLPYLLLFLGLLSYAALEIACRKYKHYHAGTDDALTLLSAGLLVTSLLWLRPGIGVQAPLARWGIDAAFCTTILTFWYMLRFGSRLLSAVFFMAFLATVLLMLQHYLNADPLSLAAAACSYSLLFYLFSVVYQRKTPISFYRSCLSDLQYLCLLTIGLAGNLGVEQLFPRLFWSWTFIFPVCCMVYGLKTRSRIILRSGMVLFLAAVIIYHYASPALALEYLLCLAGSLLLLLSGSMLLWLRKPKYGLAAHATMQNQKMPAAAFSGGSFEGEGSSSDF